jgi:hypothetical protein
MKTIKKRNVKFLGLFSGMINNSFPFLRKNAEIYSSKDGNTLMGTPTSMIS